MMKLALFALTVLAAAGTAIADPQKEEAGYLGVRLQRVEGGLAEALDIETDGGVLLGQVVEGSPADEAGLKEGDIVVALDGQKVGTPDALRDGIRGKNAGDKVALQVLRDGAKRKVTVTLGSEARSEVRAERSPRPMANRLRRHVREMRLGQEHGWLGVHTQPLSGDLGKYFGAPDGGALVSEVVADSPAAKLGLQPGDVITSVDGESVEDPEALRRIVGEHDEPAEVQVSWLRDKRAQQGKATLEMKEGFAFLEGLDAMPGLRWEEKGGPMRERVHALRMRAGDETEKALEELKEQLKKLEAQVQKLERRTN